jgi:hypothetical protein
VIGPWRRLAPLALVLACARAEQRGADTAITDTPAATEAAGDTTPSVSTPPDSAPRDTTGGAPNTRPTRPTGPAPAPTPPSEPAPSTGQDTARGVVRVVGSAPVNVSVVLAPEGSTERIRLTGRGATALRALGGVDVVVRGTRTSSGELDVQSFTVRSVNGEPAVDGVLVADGSALAIETDSGRRRIGSPPDALRGLVGARVWITGRLDSGAITYGVIER